MTGQKLIGPAFRAFDTPTHVLAQRMHLDTSKNLPYHHEIIWN